MYQGLRRIEDKIKVDGDQLMGDRGQGIVHYSRGKPRRPAIMQFLKLTCPKSTRLTIMLFNSHRFKR